MKVLGKHILAEFYGCTGQDFDDVKYVEAKMKEAAIAANATIVESCFHHFNPHGVSGAVVISESHLTVHTWPEYQYAAVDIFTCGDACNPHRAIDYLKKAFHAENVSSREIYRGLQTKDRLSKEKLALSHPT